ncbi:MAG TPA: hypothetical protein VFA27_03755 [Vicinamibacterales bacterium]|nr:hypothetical protein [Vicinamibacterales bacterium]
MALVGVATLAIGGRCSLWLYLQARYHFPFRGAFQSTRWFILGWHSAYLPLNALWCATSVAVGALMARVDRERRLSFVVVGIAAQIPVLIWFAWPVVQALGRPIGSPPPWPEPWFRVAFGADLIVLLFAMPALTLAAARRAGHRSDEGLATSDRRLATGTSD